MIFIYNDNDADDHDIIYVIHVKYIKAWAAGVGAASLKVLINDDVSVSLNSSIMNMMKVMVMDVTDYDDDESDGDGCKWWWKWWWQW